VLGMQDDGWALRWLPCANARSAGGSLGVLGMQERATLMGGQLDIESMPGLGSTVQHALPRGTAPRRNPMKPVRALLADDHTLVRAGLRKLLESIPDYRGGG
jgi:signal transduction histidine kinase